MNKYHVSVIDTDLYKLSMGNAISKLYPKVKAKYTFINRDQRQFPEGFGTRLQEIVNGFRDLSLTSDEYEFLREKCYYLDPVYLDLLKGYRYDPAEVYINQDEWRLEVTVEGLWHRVVYWEVPLMETISELYFEMTNQKGDDENTLHMRNRDKAQALADVDVYYSEFGARRRYSHENQIRVVEGIKGAQATALAIFLARHNAPKETIRQRLTDVFGYDLSQTVEEIKPTYLFNVTCQGSVPEAIICFLDANSYEETIRNAISLGGDTDTQACIAGGIAEAFYGGVPEAIVNAALPRLDDYFQNVINEFYARIG